jgi:hypothetical protein
MVAERRRRPGKGEGGTSSKDGLPGRQRQWRANGCALPWLQSRRLRLRPPHLPPRRPHAHAHAHAHAPTPPAGCCAVGDLALAAGGRGGHTQAQWATWLRVCDKGAIPHGHSARPDCHGATHGHMDMDMDMGMDGLGHGHGHMGGMHAPRPHGNNAHEASLAASMPGRPLSP